VKRTNKGLVTVPRHGTIPMVHETLDQWGKGWPILEGVLKTRYDEYFK